MLKFNKSTMIALYAMMELARESDGTLAAAEIAERYEISKHHLAKVLQQLTRNGLVSTIRGAAGGHRLARDAKDITLLDIVQVFEGPRQHGRSCLLLEGDEDVHSQVECSLHPVFVELDEQITFTLQSISLKTLVSTPSKKT